MNDPKPVDEIRHLRQQYSKFSELTGGLVVMDLAAVQKPVEDAAWFLSKLQSARDTLVEVNNLREATNRLFPWIPRDILENPY